MKAKLNCSFISIQQATKDTEGHQLSLHFGKQLLWSPNFSLFSKAMEENYQSTGNFHHNFNGRKQAKNTMGRKGIT